jgi:hypothetical protein
MRFPLLSPDANMWARKALPVTASSAAWWWTSTIAVDSYAARTAYSPAGFEVGLMAPATARAARSAASKAATGGVWLEATLRCTWAISMIALIAPMLA